MHWFGNLAVGARSVILKGVSPRWILEAVSEEQGTIVWLLVPWAQDILTAIEGGELDPADYRLAQWRLMHIGAQPVPPSLVHRWQKSFPCQAYDTNYGLSEATGPGCVHLEKESTPASTLHLPLRSDAARRRAGVTAEHPRRAHFLGLPSRAERI